eukprot:symbB.v1.2.016659.t1/scaffold1250.1/size128898/1
MAERFCQAETRYQHFTQFQRICQCSDALAAGVDFQTAAWITTVLCLADAKALDWYRKSGYQPKDMAHAQERIGGVMSSAVANAEPRIRTLLRLAVKAVPRNATRIVSRTSSRPPWLKFLGGHRAPCLVATTVLYPLRHGCNLLCRREGSSDWAV